MFRSLFDAIKQSSAIFGNDPSWVKSGIEPNFQTVEAPVGAKGPEMVLLHGLFGALSNWQTVTPHFADYTKPIALQFPLTTGPRTDIKVNGLALYTEYFIRKRGIEPTILCGNSLGGHVAMRLYLANPSLVKCMILSATSGLYEHSVDSLPIRPDHRFVREHMNKVFFNSRFVTEEGINEIAEILSDRGRTLNLIHTARSAKRDNMLHELKRIEVPTLLVWGEDDKVTTMEVAETFHKNIKGSKLVTIKNCGHAPMIEHPEWFADEVKKFLRDNKFI